MSAENDYWSECIWSAAEECSLNLTAEQHKCLAESAQAAHENYSMAFYSPPSSDYADRINSEWEAKFKRLQAEFDAYIRWDERGLAPWRALDTNSMSWRSK